MKCTFFRAGGWAAASVLLLQLGACAVGPDYVKPSVATTPAFKEGEGWKTARPNDAALGGGWWRLFDDPVLNRLEERVVAANQDLATAEAQYRQARALADASRAARYPVVTVGAAASRSRSSANLGQGNGTTRSDFQLPVGLSWELDLWGRIRRSVEAADAGLQASAADLAAVRLSLQAELATDYYDLRTVDAQKKYLGESIVNLEKSVTLTRNRYEAGIVSRTDLLQADNQLQSTRAALTDLGVQRAQLEHAIALLMGEPPASFSLPASPLERTPPAIPLAMPSELLERRPDIAAAERRMAAANARIGIAEAAYYPTVKIGASVGFEASDIAQWFSWPSRFWSVGPSAAATLFDGGLRKAQTGEALAGYDAAVASYRQSVLAAFREVEDSLAAARILEEESRQQEEAVSSSEKLVTIVENQYRAGVVAYLNVISARNTALADKRTAIGILGRRMGAAVSLVKALGGGWQKDGPGE